MPFLSRVRPLIRTLFIFWMLGASAYAQSTAATAAIDGIVRNSAGEVVPNAMIALRDLSTGQVRSTVSGGDGAYRISALAVSTYEVTVDSAGFAVYKIPEVTLVLGQTTTLDITLQPAGVNASVEVSDKPLTIDSSQTASTTSIAQESIEELPVKDRNYLQFTLLAPGVAPSNTRSATGGGNISSSPMADSGFTFGGLRARSNSIAIDGLSNIDEATGASLIVLSPEIVREFQVINNGVSAEFGGAAGGTINVLTKTGSNVFHGTAFTFFQNQRLNARNPFDAKRRLFHTYQPGFSLGGPLRKDKLFFYVAAEQEHMIANDEPEINRSVRSSINAALAAGFAPRLTVRALQSTVFRVGTDQTELSGKLTYLPNSFNTVNVRFAYTNNRTRGDAFNTNILYDASARGTVYSKDYQVTGSVTSVVNPNLINDLRAQFSSRHFISRSGDETGPEIDIVGVARFGRPYESDGTRNERRQEFIDTITFIRGKHELKAGVSVNHVSLNSDLGAGFGGVYIFRTLNDFLTGSAAYWRQAFGST
ncbi:MAG: carboxypeptidase regulatory-like domain-containing protein, partial [Pyrinomonadaceae bacterium]